MATWRDYMIKYPRENRSWCVPYKSKEGNVRFILCDGNVVGLFVGSDEIEPVMDIKTAKWVYPKEITEDVLRKIMGNDYDAYSRYTDMELFGIAAQDYCDELSCRGCPAFLYCEEMDAEYVVY